MQLVENTKCGLAVGNSSIFIGLQHKDVQCWCVLAQIPVVSAAAWPPTTPHKIFIALLSRRDV